jgi:methylenetetrahydrofolate dehydrogenase (NADP+)/methenyltetrahydrofolate cyclohydrolase
MEKIKELNENNSVNGIFVQLPIPEHLNKDLIINSINPNKDVDGFHPVNIGKTFLKDKTGLFPCTPYGVLKLLDYYNIERKGKNITMIGASNIVGKPLTMMLINEEATVTSCNHLTKDLKEYTLKSDIIITATGVIELIKEDMIPECAVIVDIGISKHPETGKIVGDVDFNNVSNKASFITPVPGGVGPMTVAMLMFNTVKAFKQQKRES